MPAALRPLASKAADELAIIRRKVPGCNEQLSRQIVAYVQRLRTIDLFKNPGIAETIDWATALTELDRLALDPETIARIHREAPGVRLNFVQKIVPAGHEKDIAIDIARQIAAQAPLAVVATRTVRLRLIASLRAICALATRSFA